MKTACPGLQSGAVKLWFLAGPCVIESEELCAKVARALKGVADRLGVRAVFKSSFDKANRSSLKGFRGPGIEEGLRVLEAVKGDTGLEVLTDIHAPEQAARAAEVCDILQIPAVLCRQTDVLLEAGRTGRAVNVKKGQFMSPYEMANAVEKARAGGAKEVYVTERGSSFGYNNLVVDMRSFAVMKEFADAVIFDCTHSLQLPGARGSSSGGEREYVRPLARAAVAAGADAVFLETHPDPPSALCDADTQLPLEELESLMSELARLKETLG